MRTFDLPLPPQPASGYPIIIGTDLLQQPALWLPPAYHTKRLVIITDRTVSARYGSQLQAALNTYDVVLLTCTPGEHSKNYATKQKLETQMLQQHCDRDTLILALGGGVVGDLAGFIAATYLRGIAYLQLPTTLLAMIDSSIGGKTGINTQHGKNLIGAFWQPQGVVTDINCLTTLPQKQLINGLIEAIKIALTHARAQFDYIDANLEKILRKDLPSLETLVVNAATTKIAVVSADVREAQQRLLLNFGHTIGHAIETITHYEILHGYAVALGILVEAKIAELLGLLPATAYQTIKNLLLKLKISGQRLKQWDSTAILQATRHDKKVKDNTVRYILLTALGQVHCKQQQYTHAVADAIVQRALIEASEV